MAANNILVIDANTNSFQDLVDVVSEMATFLNVKTVSVDEQVTSGNAIVNGSIQTTSLYANTISGGVIGNTALLTIDTNTSIYGTITANGNATFNGTVGANGSITANGNLTITGNTTSNVTFSKTITGGASGNTANLTVSTNTDFNQSISVNTHIVALKNISGNNVNITHTLASNNSHTVFFSGTGNTVYKNDATGFRTSLDVYSKSEANTIINNKAAEVDASAIAYAIALG